MNIDEQISLILAKKKLRFLIKENKELKETIRLLQSEVTTYGSTLSYLNNNPITFDQTKIIIRSALQK